MPENERRIERGEVMTDSKCPVCSFDNGTLCDRCHDDIYRQNGIGGKLTTAYNRINTLIKRVDELERLNEPYEDIA